MLSPTLRHISRHSRLISSIIPRATTALTSTSTSSAQPAISSPVYSQVQSPKARFQSIRMSSNSANASFKSDKLFDMTGRVALITGGGSGIGLMCTQALVANGAKVYITGRTKEKLDRVVEKYSESKGSIVPVQADITNKQHIADLVKKIESSEECLCILINNAGISGSTLQTEAGSADEMRQNLFDSDKSTFEDWTDVYRTNVAQLFFMTSAFLPLLQRSSQRHAGWSGTVINITSISGLVKTAQHHFQYNASKGAANHLTRMLASEVAGNGLKIRVNALAPGVFPSEMTTQESGDDQKSHIPREKYADKVPAGRPGKDEDMAQAVLFFAANQYLNGQTVAVDGGYTIAAGL
ncbi:hypothetical protein GGR56DRAFT_642358 [Xylariaceae sp. FL0804]|nr:hypothetical protein GGR56DRAFT_642358 [Xylariaceae sp. FL0804]